MSAAVDIDAAKVLCWENRFTFFRHFFNLSVSLYIHLTALNCLGKTEVIVTDLCVLLNLIMCRLNPDPFRNKNVSWILKSPWNVETSCCTFCSNFVSLCCSFLKPKKSSETATSSPSTNLVLVVPWALRNYWAHSVPAFLDIGLCLVRMFKILHRVIPPLCRKSVSDQSQSSVSRCPVSQVFSPISCCFCSAAAWISWALNLLISSWKVNFWGKLSHLHRKSYLKCLRIDSACVWTSRDLHTLVHIIKGIHYWIDILIINKPWFVQHCVMDSFLCNAFTGLWFEAWKVD